MIKADYIPIFQIKEIEKAKNVIKARIILSIQRGKKQQKICKPISTPKNFERTIDPRKLEVYTIFINAKIK